MFRVQGLGCLGFRFWGVEGLGLRTRGSGFGLLSLGIV